MNWFSSNKKSVCYLDVEVTKYVLLYWMVSLTIHIYRSRALVSLMAPAMLTRKGKQMKPDWPALLLQMNLNGPLSEVRLLKIGQKCT